MSSTSARVARNAGVLMVSQVLTWGMTFVLTIFLPRELGATAIGQLHLASSLWAVAGIMVGFGMDTLLTKAIARTPGRATALLRRSMLLRLGLYVVLFGALWLYASLAYAPGTVTVILVIGAGSLFWQLTNAVQATLQGLERMEYISAGTVAGKAFVTVVSLVLLFMGYGVVVMAWVQAGGGLLTLLVQGGLLRRVLPEATGGAVASGEMLRLGLPYLANGLLLTGYMQLDVVVISLLVNETVVGWYGTADRLFGTLLFIPSVFITAVFPTLARLATDEGDALKRMMRRSFDLLLWLALPMGLGMVALAGPAVRLLYGEAFAPSGPVLALFGIVLIFTYLNMLVGYFLISIDRQKEWAWVQAGALAASIPLDLLLVPWTQQQFANGAMGGAMAFIITEAGMLAAGLVLLPAGTLTWQHNGWRGLRALAAAGLMALLAWQLRDLFLPITVATGAVTYALLLWLLRVVPAEDWRLIRWLGQRLMSRLGLAGDASPA
jgi:O-antigen/teichoic acid export membrane protein